jgi:hypothetical protein
MNALPLLSSFVRPVVLLLVALSAVISGCSRPADDSMLDASALLARYEKDRRRHDPLHFSELDLGKFDVTKRRETSILYIRFHLYAVIPDTLIPQFEELQQTHGERMRQTVRETAQSCDLDQLNDPSLGWLKSELISALNDVIQTPLVRDVVFSDFSLERG